MNAQIQNFLRKFEKRLGVKAFVLVADDQVMLAELKIKLHEQKRQVEQTQNRLDTEEEKIVKQIEQYMQLKQKLETKKELLRNIEAEFNEFAQQLEVQKTQH